MPVRPEVRSACEFLGLYPLYVANEGKMIVIVPEDEADAALAAMRASPYGENAARIGRVTDDSNVPVGMVEMVTSWADAGLSTGSRASSFRESAEPKEVSEALRDARSSRRRALFFGKT